MKPTVVVLYQLTFPDEGAIRKNAAWFGHEQQRTTYRGAEE